jgi:sugar phosphate isomerase/epimerase
MNRSSGRVALVLGLGIVLSASAFGGPADGAKGLTNPFFPYCVNLPDQVLQGLGYAPIHNLYTGINLDKEPAFPPSLREQVKHLKGTGTIFWLTVGGNKAKDNDAKAVEAIRELAATADEADVRVAIYPHTGLYVATARDALRLVAKVDRKNVGLTLNLCHELMNDNAGQMAQIIDEVAPHLFVVTINGADPKEKGQKMGWDRLIQPLGQGNYDVYQHLKKIKSVGYAGPIGLQCYGLRGDPLIHLKQSIKTWKEYSARLAAEEAGAK